MLPFGTASAAIALTALLATPCARAAEAVIIVQRSPLAGFRHYAGAEVLRELKPGDRLELVREPANPYDVNAVRVEWRGVKLGYVPRRDNAAVARQMDRGVVLAARLAGARQNRNRSVRLELEIVTLLQ
ncbi:MAG TPA: HIRAN domain-containing protein [Burkholderiales bacterium]|nr:HIRAN domain-containing protein [Burkholderiales bacterium]